MTKMIAVDEAHYEYLVRRDEWLTALEAAGVDNWSGMDYAIELSEQDCE